MWMNSKNGLHHFVLEEAIIININRIFHISFVDDRPRYSGIVQGCTNPFDAYSFGAHTNLELLKFKCLIKAKEFGWDIKQINIKEGI